MMEKKRFDMYLSMKNPLHRKTWELLQSIPAGERSRTVCQAICDALDGKRGGETDMNALRDMMRDVVREELKNAGAIPPNQTSPQSESVNQVSDGAVDYLRSLCCLG